MAGLVPAMTETAIAAQGSLVQAVRITFVGASAPVPARCTNRALHRSGIRKLLRVGLDLARPLRRPEPLDRPDQGRDIRFDVAHAGLVQVHDQ